MKKERSVKQRLISAILVLVMLFTSLLGTTFAWFTDSVTSAGNTIQSGSLKVDLSHKAEGQWVSLKQYPDHSIFDYDKWEPGYTRVEQLKVDNLGSLALQYRLSIEVATDTADLTPDGKTLADVIDVYLFKGESQAEKFADITGNSNWTAVGTLAEVMADPSKFISGKILPTGKTSEDDTVSIGSETYSIALHMQESAGNEYQNLNAGDIFVNLIATQWTFENDAFGKDYDDKAEFPEIDIDDLAIEVEVEGGLVKATKSASRAGVSITIPAGVKVDGVMDGTAALVLSVDEKAESEANVKLEAGEVLHPLDVHVDGVSDQNEVAIVITIEEAMPVGLNMGNYTLYHVENGVANPMKSVENAQNHNEFYYDPATGNTTLGLATFSEVALVADTENAWEGNFDYSWYTNAVAPADGEAVTEYTIANADQLAAFGAIVGGMASDIERDSFSGKTVKLIADINLGDRENANGSLIFHPIGYYYTDDKNADGTTGDYYSTVYSFEGTFDGNGHTIANFYHNTWEIKGDYSGNYYSDAMGLFGYVVGSRDANGNPIGGIIKNLTVDNFSSDGEFTPTGVIAAYAVNSTFENIAITNCNPRVYNTGNGGIVGIGGNSDDPDSYNLTFTNITIDNTNKITALWGSWDVACGGLVGMFRGAGHAYMTNCHVAAQIDVYNDVCGNYQYYWYRYSGMMIGTNKNMITDKDGYTVPETSKFHAENCTVHFGDWNDYYYCELVANSLASYTHDHQFSRLTEIDSIDVENMTVTVDGKTTAIPTSGRCNYVVVSGEPATENATCYHFVDGKVWNHEDAGYEDFDLNGNGELDDLKEDRQHYYLPFNQLFTGYGWGVKHVPIYDDGTPNPFAGVTILDRTEANSVVKFESNVTELANNKEYKLGDIFTFVNNGVDLVPGALTVTVTNVADNNPVSATIVYDRENWENGTITLSGTGEVQITIQDYYFCTPTTIKVEVKERQDEEKFDVVMNNGDFLHRVGNVGTVALGKLFSAKENASIGTVSVTVEAVNGTAASSTYTSNATWTNGTIQFSGTGVVKVTITDNDYCIPTELTLEVVDAVNATTATSATSNNVVLLNDCGFSSLEVSGGYALYGNGFTMTCSSDSAALDMGYAFVTLNNGTLDNVQIVCPNFDYAALYKSNLTSSDNRSETDANGKTRYYNAKSGVMVSGNSQILNSRISGGRAAVNVSGGNVLIDNSRIELGAVATILVGAANSLTLRDVTLIQKPTASTYDSNKKLMGFSVLYLCDSEGKATPTTLEGSFVQQAWVNADDKQYVPSAGQDIVDGVMKENAFIHNINGKDSLNLGFAYMPEDAQKTVAAPDNITDNRTDKATIPYEMKDVNIQIAILSTTVYVYSYKNTSGTVDSFKTESEYVPNKYGDIITVTYSDTADGLTAGKSFGTDGWVYELNVDLDKLSGYALDFSKLSMSVNGVAVTDFKVDGNAKPTSPVAVTAGGTIYTLTATVNDKEYTATYKVTGTETSKESPSLVASNYEAGLCVASSYGGTWHGAAPALQGIQIKYWSVAEKQYKTINLSDYTPTTKGQLNGTNTTWTYSPANGDFTLTLTGGLVHSSNKVYAMPVVCNGKLYFVAASSNGLVNSGNSARTIPVTYSFKDNNNGDVLTFSHTWSVAENKDAQYKYSDFCNGTLTQLEASSGGTCVTPDTLITLADGTQMRVDSLTGAEELLVWNMVTGKLDKAPIMFVDSDPEAEYEIIHLYFSDGTDVKVIYEHGFWDYDLNKYVYLDQNAAQYIGHTFAKQNGETLEKVQLVDVVIETEATTAWSPVTAEHLCYFVNGMLSMPGGVGGLFNIFDVDPETMTYDQEAMQRDIETYGLYTYEELNAICPLSEDMFNAAGGAYLKISIGKGNLTEAELIAMITRYSKFFS